MAKGRDSNILFWRHLEEIELAKRFASYQAKKIQFFRIRSIEHNDINFCSNSKVYLN